MLELLREKQLIKETRQTAHRFDACAGGNTVDEPARAGDGDDARRLNDLSEAAPIWLNGIAPTEWFVRYATRLRTHACRAPKKPEPS
jgi:hypothetical protein